jgi:hypothetical protein
MKHIPFDSWSVGVLLGTKVKEDGVHTYLYKRNDKFIRKIHAVIKIHYVQHKQSVLSTYHARVCKLCTQTVPLVCVRVCTFVCWHLLQHCLLISIDCCVSFIRRHPTHPPTHLSSGIVYAYYSPALFRVFVIT